MNSLRPIPLTGINGANPLGFLAALGTFRTAQQINDVLLRLSWAPTGGTWQPILHAPPEITPESLVESLHTYLQSQVNSPVFTVAKNTKMPADRFRSYAKSAVDSWFSGDNPAWAAFAAAFSASFPLDEEQWTEDTAFRFVRVFKKETDKNGKPEKKPGFLDIVRTIAKNTTDENLREALFGPWKFQDDEFSLRWDPEDDRRYAFRWSDPSKDSSGIVRGANRLAIEGLPFFPTIPSSSQLRTTGFVGRKSTDTFWTWPLWKPPITAEVCRSILASASLAHPNIELTSLASIGVVAVFRSQRINPNDGKFRNFTPATPVGA